MIDINKYVTPVQLSSGHTKKIYKKRLWKDVSKFSLTKTGKYYVQKAFTVKKK